MTMLTCDKHEDPVDRIVRDLTAEETFDWLKLHGLPEDCRSTVVPNLREQYNQHNLRGRLWRGSLIAWILARYLKLV